MSDPHYPPTRQKGSKHIYVSREETNGTQFQQFIPDMSTVIRDFLPRGLDQETNKQKKQWMVQVVGIFTIKEEKAPHVGRHVSALLATGFDCGALI